MALETATYIDGLNSSNPAASDAINTADDHLRLIKTTIKSTFPNITGAVTVTQSQLNDIPNKAPLASPALTGTPTAPTAAVNTDSTQIATTAFVRDIIPAGIIAMWSGTIATVPSGWFLCDGQNNTPDLRDRFIIGARQDDSGVAKTNVTGSPTQTGGSKDASAVSHTHTFSATSGSAGSHAHNVVADGTYTAGTSPWGGGTYIAQYGSTLDSSYRLRGTDAASPTVGATSTAADHTHSVSGTTDSTGSSGTNANLPPYYALAFIMKA